MGSSINLAAPVNKLGYGVAGLNILKALDAAGYEPALWPIGGIECQREEDAPIIRTALARAGLYDGSVPSLRVWHEFDQAQHVGRGLHAAYPFFELDTLSDIAKHQLSASADTVFASSQWSKETLVSNGIPAERVVVAPPGVDATIFHSLATPAQLPPPVGPETCVFFTCGKFEVRKGHDKLVEAFSDAFNTTDDVVLLMNCHNPFLTEEQTTWWYNLCNTTKMGQAGKVLLARGRLQSQLDLAKLMARADCGVFPARAEGFNLEAAEMLAMGKSVILSRTTAHTEYLDEAGAIPIEFDGRMEPANDGVFFHGQGNWPCFGQAQHDQLVEKMRSIFNRKRLHGGRLPINLKGVQAFKTKFTWENCARRITEGLGI